MVRRAENKKEAVKSERAYERGEAGVWSKRALTGQGLVTGN